MRSGHFASMFTREKTGIEGGIVRGKESKKPTSSKGWEGQMEGSGRKEKGGQRRKVRKRGGQLHTVGTTWDLAFSISPYTEHSAKASFHIHPQ